MRLLRSLCVSRMPGSRPVSTNLQQSTFQRSFVSTQTNIARTKPVFYRVSGLGQGTSEKDVSKIIKQYQRKGEERLPTEIEVLPACSDSNKDPSMISIVKFLADEQPAFLTGLDRNPLEDLTVLYKEENGVQRQITFDRHFHGFTQLYNTKDDQQISAE